MNDLETIVQRFAGSECSWLGTVRPSGKPHTAPVWHTWHEGKVYVVATGTAVKTRNIQTNPAVTITHPDPLNVIIIEGEARLAEEMREGIRPSFQEKYDWDITADQEYGAIIEITPLKLMAWGQEGAGKRQTWGVEELRSEK